MDFQAKLYLIWCLGRWIPTAAFPCSTESSALIPPAGCIRDLRLNGRYMPLDSQPRDGVSQVSVQGLSVGCSSDSCKKYHCKAPFTCVDLWRVHECRYTLIHTHVAGIELSHSWRLTYIFIFFGQSRNNLLFCVFFRIWIYLGSIKDHYTSSKDY